MIIKNKHRTNKKFLIAAVIAGVLLIAAIAYFIISRNNDPTRTYTPQYPESVKTSESDGNIKSDDKTRPDNPVSPQSSQEVPASNSGSLSITNLNQQDGFVNALASVNNFTTNKCVYLFTSEGAKPVVREQSGVCSGVSIPQVEFDKIGGYTLTVTAYGNSSKLEATQEISIR